MKRVKEQPTDSIFSEKRYWDSVKKTTRQGMEEADENPRANPDKLDEAMSMYQVKEAEREVQGRVRKLMELSKQILTQQQYNVFVLMAVKDPALTERETAKALSITRGRVHQLWVIARNKLEKAYNERTA